VVAEDEVGEDDDGVSVVVVVAGGVVVVVTGGRVTGGLVTGGFVTGGCVTGGWVVVGGGGTTTRSPVDTLLQLLYASMVCDPAVVLAGTVAPTDPLAAEAAEATCAPSSVKVMGPTMRHGRKLFQEMVMLPPAVAGCGAAVTTAGGTGVVVWAAAGVVLSTVTPAARATSKPKDRIPSPRIRT
jgi:hypothetical protein